MISYLILASDFISLVVSFQGPQMRGRNTHDCRDDRHPGVLTLSPRFTCVILPVRLGCFRDSGRGCWSSGRIRKKKFYGRGRGTQLAHVLDSRTYVRFPGPFHIVKW